VASTVFAEGVAAWVDHCIDDGGDVVANVGRPAAIVDVGGRTTDCVTTLPGWKVDHARSGTTNRGVLDLFETVAAGVRTKFNLPDVPLQIVEDAVRTGEIVLWNQSHDIREMVEAARRELSDQILREIMRRIGRAADLERVLFVGGGALVLPDLKKHFPNAVVPADPEFANARGLLKWATHVI
jgi:plasmid segregation protein ParM